MLTPLIVKDDAYHVRRCTSFEKQELGVGTGYEAFTVGVVEMITSFFLLPPRRFIPRVSALNSAETSDCTLRSSTQCKNSRDYCLNG